MVLPDRIIGTVDVPSTLLVTNDFPPRVGGIQRMLGSLVDELPPDRIAVLAPSWGGAASFDAAQSYRTFRDPQRFIWPSSRFLSRIMEVLEETKAEVVVFGAASPLAVLGPQVAAAGTPYLVVAHGFEYWLSLLPGSHALMRVATARASRVTACWRSSAGRCGRPCLGTSRCRCSNRGPTSPASTRTFQPNTSGFATGSKVARWLSVSVVW
jgi:hypothetical protein